MLCFVMALRSSKTTNQWDQVVLDFNNTLRSIFNQTSNNFKVFVVCSEIPPLFQKYDDRLEIITVDFPIPSKWVEYCRDRALKLMVATMVIKKDYIKYMQPDGGIFIFPVDADDLIHRQVVEYVDAHPSANGFKSKKGLVWKKNQKYMEQSECYGGSCNIMKLFPNELADSLPQKEDFFLEKTGQFLVENYKICWDDHEVIHKFRKLDRAFTSLPFPSTVYVLGTGENISDVDPRKDVETKGRFEQLTGIPFKPIYFLRKINPFTKRFLTHKLKKDFAIE